MRVEIFLNHIEQDKSLSATVRDSTTACRGSRSAEEDQPVYSTALPVHTVGTVPVLVLYLYNVPVLSTR